MNAESIRRSVARCRSGLILGGNVLSVSFSLAAAQKTGVFGSAAWSGSSKHATASSRAILMVGQYTPRVWRAHPKWCQALLVQQRNVLGGTRLRERLDVRVDVREFLVRHHLG